MASRGIPRPEAELARARARGGRPAAFIAATFDPHGNEDAEFLRHADWRSVEVLPALRQPSAGRTRRALPGAGHPWHYQPAHVTVKVPIISPTVVQWTGASPWMDLVQRALTWEAREPDVYVNVFFGFPWSDVPDAA